MSNQLILTVELRIDRGKQLYPRFAVMWKPGEITEESSVFYKPRWRREASSPTPQEEMEDDEADTEEDGQSSHQGVDAPQDYQLHNQDLRVEHSNVSSE